MLDLTHVVVFLTFVQTASAYCVSYCWYGSWYIWFAIVMTFAICCGALGSYLRRRRLQQALRAHETTVVTVVDQTAVGVVPGSDISHPYVYPGPYVAGGGAAGATGPVPPPYSGPPGEKKSDNLGLPPTYSEATAMSSTSPTDNKTPYPTTQPAYPTTQPPYPTTQPPYPPQAYPPPNHSGPSPPYPPQPSDPHPPTQ